MGTVPTGRMERELRKLYLRWLSKIKDHEDDLPSYIQEFKNASIELIERMGGEVASLGAYGDFPAPKLLDLSPHIGTIYSDMEMAAIRAGISIGQNATTTAQAMYKAGIGKSFNRLNRLARTETVSAYWKNQWDSTKGLGLVMLWSVERSNRTCDICHSYDGLVVANNSIRDHPNGRCTLIPTLLEDVKYKGTLQADGSVVYDKNWNLKYKEKEEPVKAPRDNRRATPKVDKLKRIAKSKLPKNLDQAVAGGAANPKNASWIESKPGAPELSASELSKAKAYNTNCTRVATATEMRRRGFNVTAAPVDYYSEKTDKWVMDNWYDPLTGNTRNMLKRNSAKELMSTLEKFDDGARFLIAGPWKGGGAHIWNAEKIDGKVRFIEGQVYSSDGQDRTELYLNSLDFEKRKGTINQVRWVRVDDLEPTDDIVEALRK